MIINLIRDPEISNKVILKFAFRQIKAIGYAKVLSMLLGALIVAASSVIKIPQIKKITAPPTVLQRVALAQGVPQSSVRLEALSQLIHVTYNQRSRKSFVMYGESLLLGIQNAALLLILEYYKLRKEGENAKSGSERDQVIQALKGLAKPAAIIIGAVFLVNKIIPLGGIGLLQILCIPLSIAAKIPQIQRNKELKSTAHLSLITISANVAGSLIRVFTTVSNFKKGRTTDLVLLSGYLTSFALNSVLMGQIIKYKQ